MISTIRTVSVSFIAAVALAVGLTTVGIAPATAAPGDWTTVAKTAEGKMKSTDRRRDVHRPQGHRIVHADSASSRRTARSFAKGVIRGAVRDQVRRHQERSRSSAWSP